MHPSLSATSSPSRGHLISFLARHRSSILVTGLAWLFGGPAGGATFNIANGDVAALRNAINTANTNAQNDIINLATSGSYVFSNGDAGGSSALPPIGRDGNHPDPFHTLTINGNYSTLAPSSEPGTPEFRLLTISNGTGDNTALVTISNLTLTNGLLTEAGSYGGGLAASGNAILNYCTLANNSAPYAGGIVNSNGGLTMNNCTLSGNRATGGTGGALWNGNAANRSATVVLTNCTLSGNSASAIGGSIYNQDSDDDGHGNSVVTLYHCTLSGGSIHNSGFNSIAKVILGNTILSNCPLGNVTNPGNTASDIFTEGYNMSTDSGNGFLTHAEDFVLTTPGLDPEGLKPNGGNTRTIALVAGSAAIDQGYAFGIGSDQRGLSRPVNNPVVPNNNDGTDIGAFEAAADPSQRGVGGFVVTTTYDGIAGVAGAIDCTLREALQRTNANPDLNSIRFAPGLTGTITLQGATGGELSISNPVSITGPGARLLAISGNTTYRIFTVGGPGTSSITGLTFKNGWVAGSSGQSAEGGGIHNTANLVLGDCTFDFNRAVGGSGSALGQAGGSSRGGAIFNSGTLSLQGCTFRNNGASGGFGANNPPPDDFTLTTGGAGGSASGGAVFNNSGAGLTMTNCTFSANNAGAAAGGSGHWGGNGGSGLGGAVYSLGTANINASTVSGNTGFGGSGGTGKSSFFTGSTGLGAGGLAVVGSGAANVRNTISAGNSTTGTFRNDIYGTFVSNGYNLIGKIDGGSGFNHATDQSGTAATPLNAQLNPLANNGGPTDTFRPAVSSPAIDKGYNSGLSKDQRGRGRPADFPLVPNASGGDGSDIGAFEQGGLIIVTTLDDHDDGAATPDDTTLREAINAANLQTGEDETITFGAGVTGNLDLGSALPQIATNMSIAGPGATRLTVRRSHVSDFRVFNVSNNTTSGPTVSISGITIANGRAGSGTFPQNCGGGILNSYSSLTISSCVITGNSCTSLSSSGGGIFNYGGTLTVTHSTVSENAGFNAGGIGNHRPAAGSATVNLNNCTFSANSASGGNGGAIHNDASGSGSSAIINLTHCTLSGNLASGTFGGSGAGAYNSASGGGSANTNLTHCTLFENTSATGGGIANINSGGTAAISLKNSILKNSGGSPNLLNSGGMVTSQGFNLCNDSAGGDGSSGPGGLLNATGDLRNTNPLLGSLANHGGPTLTHMPLAGSPALDRGKSFAFALDQRGSGRIADSPYLTNASGGDGSDIGALEAGPFASVSDADGDGMADEWESYHGVGDPDGDPDNDGRSNRQEFGEATIPRDSSSYLLRVIAISLDGSNVMITFNGVADRTVVLERKVSLSDETWTNTGIQVTPGTTNNAQITHPGGVTGSTGFYRLRQVP